MSRACIRHLLLSGPDDKQLEALGLDGIRQAWEACKDEFLTRHIATRPCSRPWAWWEFEAPERRRCISGQHPFDRPERKKKVKACIAGHGGENSFTREIDKLHWGVPKCSLDMEEHNAQYEPEADYLQRHGLLTENEKQALAAQEQAEPVET